MKNLGIGGLHAVGVFDENIDHELLVLRFPPSVPWVLVHDRLDIFLDILHLPALVV